MATKTKKPAEEQAVKEAAAPVAEVKADAPAEKPAAKKPAAKKTTTAKKAAPKKAAEKPAAKAAEVKADAPAEKAAKKPAAKKAAAKKPAPKKLKKIVLEIEGEQFDFKAIEKKAAKLGGEVYVVVGEKKLYNEDGNSIDL
ncbi:MAG: hypothetical protein II695_04900 [Oscillospiraceae bacterium]|nr:hypothetical protein [Oscillospiraceae bacterium]